MASRLFLCRFCCLLLLAALLVPASAVGAEGRKYALLVGVRDYDHAKLPPLRYTENDVEDLGRLLQARGSGFGPPRRPQACRALGGLACGAGSSWAG